MRHVRVGLLVLALAGCGKADAPKVDDRPASSAASTASAPASAAASVAASVAASGGAAPAASSAPAAGTAGAETWQGKFTAKVGAVTPPKEAEVRVWAKDPGTELVGEGSLKLEISGAAPRRDVRGEGTGALGDLLISGELEGTEFRARVDPKNPNDPKAMTGVLQGSLKGDKLELVLRVASRNANVVREAEVSASR